MPKIELAPSRDIREIDKCGYDINGKSRPKILNEDNFGYKKVFTYEQQISFSFSLLIN